ncbi:hypothetical protein M413DRAFT_28109 [Hebeloma cylindrosporum]|uniref:non-specific serine/threonine protein kinase n=1 Tax=Hebeloma cylindrosporum TaxID=76867 RepID=A0A0C2YIY2_HEBCY|nr:hypothetical protein M413DRAFT_28109 [Hebeloma cylindrosporum h7]
MAKVGYTANILRVHGLFQDFETGLFAMVMDYGGPTLRRTKGNQPFTEEEQQALRDALHHLHNGANVVHGDITAHNIVIGSSLKIYFIDFHCAQIFVNALPDVFEYDWDALEEVLL